MGSDFVDRYHRAGSVVRTLVIYESRDDTTRELAQTMGRVLHADVEELSEPPPLRRFLRWFGAHVGGESAEPACAPRPAHCAKDYDLVVIGTRVASGGVPARLRSFLLSERESLPDIAFFCTSARRNCQATFTELLHLCAKPALGILDVCDAEALRAMPRAVHFASALQRVTPLHAGPAAAHSGNFATTR